MLAGLDLLVVGFVSFLAFVLYGWYAPHCPSSRKRTYDLEHRLCGRVMETRGVLVRGDWTGMLGARVARVGGYIIFDRLARRSSLDIGEDAAQEIGVVRRHCGLVLP